MLDNSKIESPIDTLLDKLEITVSDDEVNKRSTELFDYSYGNLNFSSIYSEARPVSRGALFHKRIVLAAEILHRLQDDIYMGHLKLQKIVFLCFNHLNLEAESSYQQHKLGPYDPKLMRSIDKQIKINNWFEYKGESFPKYSKLSDCGGHKEWYDKYFREDDQRIQDIIKLFKKFKSSQIELVCTIYALLLKIESDELSIEDTIIEGVYNWSDEKKKFSETQIINAFKWMNENSIIPK